MVRGSTPPLRLRYLLPRRLGFAVAKGSVTASSSRGHWILPSLLVCGEVSRGATHVYAPFGTKTAIIGSAFTKAYSHLSSQNQNGRRTYAGRST